MRRAEGKLSAFNWKLVLFAGIFQILTLIFDQVVIQYEEKNRGMTFNLLTESEQRSAYLSMNRRVYNFTLAFENIIFFTTSSNFSDDKREYLYSSYLSDQVRLIEDIFRDGSIKKVFLNKKIEAENMQEFVETLTLKDINIKGGPEIPMKVFKYEDFFMSLVKQSNEIIDLIKKEPNLKLELDESKLILNSMDLIQSHVEYNTFYLYDLASDLADLIRLSEKKIDIINTEISSIQTNKQLMLLMGVVFQLLSLLCLLFLFRNILSMNRIF
jgi:hypothetical protein